MMTTIASTVRIVISAFFVSWSTVLPPYRMMRMSSTITMIVSTVEPRIIATSYPASQTASTMNTNMANTTTGRMSITAAADSRLA
jgi:hypothetical protein